MPAIEHSFSGQLPNSLYIDTDIFVASLTVDHPNYARAATLIEQIARAPAVSVYLSSLCWVEYAHAVSRDSFRRLLPLPIQRQLRLHAWQRREFRRRYFDTYLGLLRELLDQFTWNEIPLTPPIGRYATQLMADYALGSQDAVHLASASLTGVQSFASFDETYRRVDGLHLWNDLIHTQPPA